MCRYMDSPWLCTNRANISKNVVCYIQTKSFASLWLVMLTIFPLLSSSSHHGPPLAIPGLDKDAYIQFGDINIGFFPLTTQPTSSFCPSELLVGSAALEYTESVAFAVELVNSNPNLLPNLTLGFIEFNDCGNRNVALAKALSFLPRARYPSHSEPVCIMSTPSVANGFSDSRATKLDDEVIFNQEMPYYDVIGVISPFFSTSAVLVSRLLGGARIPVVGCSTTSDELSDKTHYPYFMRLIPPDRNIVKAMLSFIDSHRWSYISVIYAHGTYGEQAFDNLKLTAPNHGICIATSHCVDDRTNFEAVAKDLLEFRSARVVVLFIFVTQIQMLFASIDRLNATSHFIWIGADGFTTTLRSDFKGFEKIVAGSFAFDYHRKLIPEFYYYLRDLNITVSANPWLMPVWEKLTGCSIDNTTCVHETDILLLNEFGFSTLASGYIDIVMVFAHALHNLMADLCPGATGPDARECIKGETLMQYLRKISIQGSSGLIELDENGDPLGKYEIKQIVFGYKEVPFVNMPSVWGLEQKIVGFYDLVTEQISYTNESISWDHLLHVNGETALPHEMIKAQVPESVCSQPCMPGEYKIQKELECCWQCGRCRDNERLTNGNTSCKDCELFTWPDPDTAYTTCTEIPLTYTQFSDTLSLVEICMAAGGMICIALVVTAYIYFRELKVIKASSKELSFLQMVAIIVGYITVIAFKLKPTHAMCGVLYFMFCISFTWIYAPMIVKAIRVYRIFLSSSKHSRKPRFVSPHAQIVMAGILIAIQILLCVVIYSVSVPTAKKSQPVLTEKFVELFCDMTLPGLASFLVYNLLLISVSLALAFKTRKLPNNFNEAWFILMCASTTLIIWLAFIPTYFTAKRESIRSMLLSLALFLNHTVALIFLFLPKIYAAFCVAPETMGTTVNKGDSNDLTQSQEVPGPCYNHKVHPTPGSSHSNDSTQAY